MKKKILWLLTGGTFSCVKTPSGLAPVCDKDKARDMLAQLPLITEKCDIEPVILMNKDSTDIAPDDWEKIAAEINTRIGKIDGVVITHGTDTMAYTAAVLSVMLENPPIPIILTGSQLPWGEENTDAAKNLADAFTVSADSRIRTVAVVFAGQIFSGLDVYKADSVEFSAFAAHEKPLGAITANGVELWGEIPQGEYRYTESLCYNAAVIKVTPLTRKEEITSLLNSNIRGLVIEGFGLGGIPSRLIPALSELSDADIQIRFVSQCPSGGASLDVYKVGRQAAEIGIQSAGALGTEAALALLMKHLTASRGWLFRL